MLSHWSVFVEASRALARLTEHVCHLQATFEKLVENLKRATENNITVLHFGGHGDKDGFAVWDAVFFVWALCLHYSKRVSNP